MKLRFGIIGCGGASVPVAKALASSEVAELAAAYDLNPALAQDLTKRFGGAVHDTLAALLADPSLQSVYIAVPHHLAAGLAAQALRADKHALVEKPMALSLAEVDELIALADERYLALGVFYELRETAAVVQARELVRAGAIGEIIGVNIQTLMDKPASYWLQGYSGRWVNSWRGSKTRAGGGVVLMNSSHALDAVRYITGLEVASVSAQAAALVAPVEVEDTAAASLRYKNGAIGSLFAGAHLAGVNPGGEHGQLYGTEGQLRLPNLYGDDPVTIFLRREWGTPAMPAGEWLSLPHTPRPMFEGAVDAFATAAQRGEAAPTSGRDARAVLEIILAMYRSAETQTVQKIGA